MDPTFLPAVLSICIPIYQLDLHPLVSALQAQMAGLFRPVELLLMDDGSGEKWRSLNADLAEQPHTRLIFLPANVGRAAIRNRLAEAAQQPYLLFLDNDAELVRPDFLARYLAALEAQPKAAVICGGRVYAAHPPEAAYLLHWRYGHARESLSAEQRQQQPHRSFMTNNFLIRRDLLLDVRFDERLRQYGHEDTLFGFRLAQRTVPMLHIDNPVQHGELETNATFLRKTEQGIENLVRIWRDFDLPPGFEETVTLLRAYRRLRRAGLLLRGAYGLLRPWLQVRLLAGTAPMRGFDAYKLLYLARMVKFLNS